MTTPDPQQPAACMCGRDGEHVRIKAAGCGPATPEARPDDTERLREALTEVEFNTHGELAGRFAWDRKVFTEEDVLSIVAGRLADREKAVQQALKVHRDLTSRLGFGDGLTEPQADNDTIVRWVDERVMEANEWRESIRWQDDCYAAGHEDPITCPEHEPTLVAVQQARADIAPCSRCGVTKVVNPRPTEDTVICGECGAAEATAAVVERVEAVASDLWRATPCGCGHRADLHGMTDGGCIGGLSLCRCNWSFPRIVTERLCAALTEPTP